MTVSGVGAQSQRQMGQQQRLAPATIDQILQTDVVSVSEGTTISDAVSRMKSEDVGCVIVVDDDQKPTGILTDRKVALALEETPDLSERTVSEITSGNLTTGSAEMNIFDAIQRLNEESIRRLPIVGDDGTLDGILTLDDIIVLLATELNSSAEIIKAQSPRL
jgi:CBS domain-containing protein